MGRNYSEYSLADPRVRLNGVCPYLTMFKLSVPARILAKHRHARILLDPFCGRGTSLYAARLGGLPSVGIDVSPVAVAISRAKVASIDIGRIEQLLNRALTRPTPANIPSGEFWERCFHPATLIEVCAIREHLIQRNGDSADILRAVVLGLLHGPQSKVGSYFSNQMPRTYATKPDAAVRYWRKHRLFPRRVDVAALIKRRLAHLLPGVPPSAGGKVYSGDSRSVLHRLPEKADLVVTSPPYMGLRTYLPDQWLRSWFLGGPPDVRYELRGQIGVESEERFTAALTSVLKGLHVATQRKADAYILLGSIPSVPADIADVMGSAIDASASPWKLVSRRSYGPADKGRRQAIQFASSSPAEEFLFHLRKG